MKKGVALYLMVYVLNLFASNDIESVREMYYHSIEDNKVANKFLNYFDTVDVKNNATLMGYNAVANFVQSKHSWNPYTKLEHFNAGKEQLEYAIIQEGENIELRFLRLSIQENLPSFLGYNSQIKADRSFLVDHLDQILDEDLKSKISTYLKTLKAI